MNTEQIGRCISIGHEIVGINSAISEGKVGYSNRHLNKPKFEFYETELFKALSLRREALRAELLRLESADV